MKVADLRNLLNMRGSQIIVNHVGKLAINVTSKEFKIAKKWRAKPPTNAKLQIMEEASIIY